MDFVAHPTKQVGVLTLGKFAFQAGEVGSGAAHELRGVEVTQRIGWEIAEVALAPMNILQATLGILWHFQAEHFLKLFVPESGNVAGLELALDESDLDFESQDDVQIVSDLVSLNTNEGGRDPIDGDRKLRRRQTFEVRKMLARDGMPMLPKGRVPPHVVFPKARLGLMNPQ